MDTIVALATPRGRSALAIVRVSGEDSLKVCAPSLSGIERAAPRSIRRMIFLDPQTNHPIDDVTAIRYTSPRSYTGEEMVEIFCHGSTVVVDRILAVFLRTGARSAEPGEFTRRAVMNGKIGLLQAEAIREIIETTSDPGATSALTGYFGGARGVVDGWRRDLVEICADVESQIEFGDEGDVRSRGSSLGAVHERILRLADVVAVEIRRRDGVRRLESGLVVALVGPRNAGKSSLFNALIGADRAIVHSDPGTTRDVVSERVRMGGVEVTLVDTAGVGVAESSVEALGLERSWAFVSEADLVVWVTPADEELQGEEARIPEVRQGRDIIGVVSKRDLAPAAAKIRLLSDSRVAGIGVSLLEGAGAGVVADRIGACLSGIVGSVELSTAIQSDRQAAEASRVLGALRAAVSDGGEEVVAHHLREALSALDDLEGKNATEEVLDSVFGRFCIGK